jgi:bile acid:Na+ symporter, BASS family
MLQTRFAWHRLVLASMAIGLQPLVMLPIIVYNLVQHLIAGSVDALIRRSEQI